MSITRYAIVMVLLVIALSVTTLPLSAQEEWPEYCQMPDLEAALTTALESQAAGDVPAFLNALSTIISTTDRSRVSCVTAAVQNGMDLSGTQLNDIHLEIRPLQDANLQEADLTHAHLGASSMQRANLQEARLSFANLRGTYLNNANLLRADLIGAYLHWTDLRGAVLQRADLHGADLERAYLSGANLRWADLQNADLDRATLINAILETAYLQNANLVGVDLTGANLVGAYLYHGDGEGARVSNTKFDETTVLPDGTFWTPDTDMDRFTDPEHLDFWRSDDTESPAHPDNSN